MDVAIVGGGVAGCYCAYRLAHGSKLREIHLFEMSDRIGGRLWSVWPEAQIDVPGAPIELGGNWVGSAQKTAMGLIREVGLENRLQPMDWNGKFRFLRNRILDEDSDYQNASFPFDFWEQEEKILSAPSPPPPPTKLREHALHMILGKHPKELWPQSETMTADEAEAFLRDWSRDGRRLWQWGFWNLLAEFVSAEAYQFFLSGFGLTANFRNTNAHDAIWVLLAEGAMGDPHRLRDGYQSLPERLRERSEDRVRFHMGRRLKHIARDDRSLALHFEGETRPLTTKRLILALPRRALEQVMFGRRVLTPETKDQILSSVVPVPVTKIYHLYDKPWWLGAKEGPAVAASSQQVGDVLVVVAAATDLPMRQYSYIGGAKADKKALMMTSYADFEAAAFWSVLANTQSQALGARAWLGQPVSPASKAIARATQLQLAAMHPSVKVPDTPWAPVFQDWSRDPYGGAWHAWAAGVQSWEMREFVRQPNPELSLHICGEAFAKLQGWVEGALNSAEAALIRASESDNSRFELEPAAWAQNVAMMELN